MKSAEELDWEHAVICHNDPAVQGQLLPKPQMIQFIESIQKDAYNQGINDSAQVVWECHSNGWISLEGVRREIHKKIKP